MAQCSVKSCKHRKPRDKGISFFRIPTIISHQGQQTEKLTKQRQAAWLKNIGRTDIKRSSLVHARVCSDHFVSGKPATLYDTPNPDWSPKVKLGSCSFNDEVLKQSLERTYRRQKRSCTTRPDTVKTTSTASTDDKQHELEAMVEDKHGSSEVVESADSHETTDQLTPPFGITNMPGDLVKHLGGCHCGAVRFEVMAPRDLQVFNCNCSICTKKQNRHFIIANSCFKLLQGEDNLTCYTFNTKQAKHTFCKTCGVQSFYTPRSNPDGKGVAAHCLDEGTVDSVNIIDFDGQNWSRSMQRNTGNIREMANDDENASSGK